MMMMVMMMMMMMTMMMIIENIHMLPMASSGFAMGRKCVRKLNDVNFV